MTPRRTAVVVGDLDATRRVCAALETAGWDVRHLLQPAESLLAAALRGGVDAVAVLVPGDVTALRCALFIEHELPGVRLVVTLFDRTVADQLVRAVPNCVVTSPADIAVPEIVRACRAGRDRPRSRCGRLVAAARGQLRPHDATTRALVWGLAALVLITGADWVIGAQIAHEPWSLALLGAVRTVSTVGGASVPARLPAWYLTYSSLSILATIGVTAVFTASVVNYLHSARSVRLLGRLTVPRGNHVVVVGLGQVGLRLCLELRAARIPVVAIERDPRAANLRLARAAKVPVLIAHAEDRAVLNRLALRRAVALAAMGSDELDNVEVAIAALAVCPDLRVVLRAGESDVIAETRSLFRIGEVCNVSALTAERITEHITEHISAGAITQVPGIGGTGGTDTTGTAGTTGAAAVTGTATPPAPLPMLQRAATVRCDCAA